MESVVIEGVVTPGRRIGHTIGFPTANIPLQQGVCDKGVYRAEVKVEGIEQVFDAMSNVGCNPSVGGNELRLESHLLGFEGDLYGRRIWVRLVEKIRQEQKFATLDELRHQLERDREQILSRLR
ncbi:MAG: riboflavin kinase [Alistipes sp.]|nr:riboflavin kinase [Alistipes sp.]MBR3846979.1 riboflavin kinase [Alistipes sp.]MBR7169963.1 riboflavin kinase [Alistipes sp.]